MVASCDTQPESRASLIPSPERESSSTFPLFGGLPGVCVCVCVCVCMIVSECVCIVGSDGAGESSGRCPGEK